jgi:DNA-binding NtrC family response regulator
VNLSKRRILVVEDEDIIRLSLVKLLQRHNYNVSEAVSVKSALNTYNLNLFDVIISDLRLPGGSGVDLIDIAKDTPVIIMTSYASLRSAVEIMRKGAADYVSKPFDHDELIIAIERVFEEIKHESHNFSDSWDPLLGNSANVVTTLAKLDKVASTDDAVLISGEVGTGKRFVAKVIHDKSQYKDSEFITINCRTISSLQLESSVEYIDNLSSCSIFLADLCDLPQSYQHPILELIRRDKVRCIASTSEDLLCLSNQGKFARDLLLETAVVSINIPSLRDRPADISELSAYFINKLSQQLRLRITISESSMALMKRYSWPGNIKELKNTLHQASTLLGSENDITPDLLHLPLTENFQIPQDTADTATSALPVGENTKTLESYLVNYVLENQSNMNETQLAKNLGISRKSLWERRKKLQIPRSIK